MPEETNYTFIYCVIKYIPWEGYAPPVISFHDKKDAEKYITDNKFSKDYEIVRIPIL